MYITYHLKGCIWQSIESDLTKVKGHLYMPHVNMCMHIIQVDLLMYPTHKYTVNMKTRLPKFYLYYGK